MVNRTLTLAAALAAFAPVAAHAQSDPAPIEVQRLGELDAWSVSALSRADGALPNDLWRRTDPAFLNAVLDRLPAVYESPAAQALARRVLLSGGEAPRGDAQAAGRERFEALGKMGAADDLAIMAAGSGNALSDPLIAQYSAQAELARGRRAEACLRGRNAQGGATPPPFLLRLRAYCAAAVNDRGGADLALELLRTSGGEDAWFTGAIAAASGAPGARPPAARYENSLTTQLSLAAQLRPGPNPLANASTLALVALARGERAPQPARAQAAALAFRRGALSAQEARAILRATPAEITSALPPIATALRRVEAAPGSLDAATAISEVLRQATAPADFVAAARFFQADIAALQTAPDHAATVAFARAAIASGDTDLTQRLIGNARQAGVEETALTPLEAALVALAGADDEKGALAIRRRIDAAGASLARAAARDVAILAALGAPLDGAMQSFLLANPPQGGASANAGLMLALASAQDRRAAAEGALLAVLAAGEGGPARLDVADLSSIIRSLRALGLEQDARRFAVEALLAGQPG
jgi:hypothetical protein